MNIILRNLPNTMTTFNLICGLASIYYAFENDLQTAACLIFIGAIFDFLDGLVARFLNVSSEFGKQLDSFADIITFGVAPGFIIFHLIDEKLEYTFYKLIIISLVAAITPILSAFRLARFNIDKHQTNQFIGLPTPAIAIFFASFPLANTLLFPIFDNTYFITFTAFIIPFFLIIPIPLFSLKFKRNEKINSKLNILRGLFLFISIILFFGFKFASVPFIVFLYLILSIINNVK
ncbi:MAG: CDP-diacylglycerol--serine O-phosphatidyltransferase [Flavobacteriales bacterium]|nr:CDP-diacylglycerol--serine O-phosphatidyltransferase [Flavobacteriales bacterium]